MPMRKFHTAVATWWQHYKSVQTLPFLPQRVCKFIHTWHRNTTLSVGRTCVVLWCCMCIKCVSTSGYREYLIAQNVLIVFLLGDSFHSDHIHGIGEAKEIVDVYFTYRLFRIARTWLSRNSWHQGNVYRGGFCLIRFPEAIFLYYVYIKACRYE